LPPCKPDATPANRATTRLSFCRVDGQLFQRLPADGMQGNTYALLRLGDECPAGAVPVAKYINNADELKTNGSLGDIGPNQSGNATGTFTQLEFCLFRADEQQAPSRSALPRAGRTTDRRRRARRHRSCANDSGSRGRAPRPTPSRSG
jgi:hypothetical protein